MKSVATFDQFGAPSDTWERFTPHVFPALDKSNSNRRIVPALRCCWRIARVVAALGILVLVGGQGALGHEFWIDAWPETKSADDAIVADLKVGVMLKGESYPYIPDYFVVFHDFVRGQPQPLTGVLGDMPATTIRDPERGLHVLVLQTVAFRASYEDWSTFRRYLDMEGLAGIAEMHAARGLPESGFSERYIRYAKALVQVGEIVEGETDIVTGMKFELRAEANPYRDGLALLPVALSWEGRPAADRQISIYHEGENVTRQTISTDDQGRAMIPLSGPGRYLLNAVLMEPYEVSPSVWESHWASLSFVIGGR